MGIVAGVGSARGKSGTMAVMRLKTGFAANHLLVATSAARDAHAIELANVGAPFGPWFDGMMRVVPVSVTMAAAALEACANELLQAILDDQNKYQLSSSRKKLLLDLKDERTGNAVGKFRKLALLMDKDPATGTEPWNDAGLLIQFRNEFMHFKPSWDDDEIHRGKLVEDLKRKIPVVDVYKGNFLFPYGFMTYGCAKWAVRTVLKFSSKYTSLLGTADLFALPGHDLTLP